jgi:hypothetical protein
MYGLIFWCVLFLLDRCWRLVFLALPSALFLLIFESLVAAVLLVCRHFYYRKYALIVEAQQVVVVADAKEEEYPQQENQSLLGTLQEAAFCDRFGKRCILEFEATGVVGVASGMEERGQTCYGTMRVRKAFRVSHNDPPVPCQVMVIPGNPASAILSVPQFWPIVVGIPVFFVSTLMFSVVGVFIPLYFFGYSDDNTDCTQDDDMIIRCINGCRDWEVQAAFVLAALLASILVKINSVTDASNVVIIAGDQPLLEYKASSPATNKV